MSPKTYLITGASRGIGLALVNEIASKSSSHNILIFAGVRDPSRATAVTAIADKYPGVIEIVPYVSADVEGNKLLAQTIKDKVGYIDTVIASAGIFNYLGTVAETPVEVWRDHLEVNAVGILVLFQAMFDLLKASSAPKFIPLASGLGSLTLAISHNIGFGAYGVSKAAVNYLARKIHFENEWLICFPLSPGTVKTDMAKEAREREATGALGAYMDSMGIEPSVSAALMMEIIDNATRKEGGEFLNVDGSKFTW